MFKIVISLAYLILISLSDLRWQQIPNAMLFALFTSIFSFEISSAYRAIPAHLLCAVFFGIVFFLITYYTKGLGVGDIKLAAVLGYSNGFIQTVLILTSAAFLGLIFYLLFLIFRKKINVLPFAPFVLFGYLITLPLVGRINELL